jgi:16S rRNA (guanine527-N7)-methyltransferase
MKLAEAVTFRGSELGIQLERGLTLLGLVLDRGTQDKLLQYLEILRKWNRVYNLTGIRELEKMVSGHLLDSLAIVPHISARRVLDVGSGAGLPGIPLALASPAMEVILLESNQKKVAFMRQATAELGLANAKVVCARVEDWRSDQQFDVIVCRAFGELSEFIRAAGHLLAPNGRFAAMKGHFPQEEVNCLPGEYRVAEVVALKVPDLHAARHLIFVERA